MPLLTSGPYYPKAVEYKNSNFGPCTHLEVIRMAKREAKVTESTGKRPIQDLREWLARIEEMGDLIRIKQPPRRRSCLKLARVMRRVPSRLAFCGISSAQAYRGLRSLLRNHPIHRPSSSSAVSKTSLETAWRRVKYRRLKSAFLPTASPAKKST